MKKQNILIWIIVAVFVAATVYHTCRVSLIDDEPITNIND